MIRVLACLLAALVGLTAANGVCHTRLLDEIFSNVEPTVTRCPYEITSEPWRLDGSPTRMVLNGTRPNNRRDPFQAFLLSVNYRLHPVGTMRGVVAEKSQPETIQANIVCNGTILQHADMSNKYEMVFDWVAPEYLRPTDLLQLKLSVSRDDRSYWTNCLPRYIRSAGVKQPGSNRSIGSRLFVHSPFGMAPTTTEIATEATEEVTTLPPAPTTTETTTVISTSANTTANTTTTATTSVTSPTTTTSTSSTTTPTTTVAASSTTTSTTTTATTSIITPTTMATSTLKDLIVPETTAHPRGGLDSGLDNAVSSTTRRVAPVDESRPRFTAAPAGPRSPDEITPRPRVTIRTAPADVKYDNTTSGPDGDFENQRGVTVEPGIVLRVNPNLQHAVLSDYHCTEGGNAYVIIPGTNCTMFTQMWATGEQNMTCSGQLRFNVGQCSCTGGACHDDRT